MDQFITIALIPALQLDSLSNSHPVSVTVQDPGEIGELFDTISYNKVNRKCEVWFMNVQCLFTQHRLCSITRKVIFE